MARKPVEKGLTIAQNVQKWGTGGINIDACRVDSNDARPLIESKSEPTNNAYGNGLNGSKSNGTTTQGRFPANLIHDGSDEVVSLFPNTKTGGSGKLGTFRKAESPIEFTSQRVVTEKEYREPFEGSASRFFYCAKARKKDRTEHGRVNNNHPTVKPTDLMQYLIRLVTPEGGTTLDPFAGSGTTAKAAYLEGFTFKGCDQDAESVEIAKERLKAVKQDHSSLASG
jgi:site-specific DNA-methyltransferase (adenine-specific)